MAEQAYWYVVHTYSGYENKVAKSIETVVENQSLQDLIEEVSVPTEKVLEVKGINLLTILETLGLTRPLCLDSPEGAALFEEKFQLISARIGETSGEALSQLMGETYSLLCALSLLVGGTPPAYGYLNLIRERLESNLDLPVSIASLAEEFHLNPVVMSRNFRKKFGCTPREYRIACRMEHGLIVCVFPLEGICTYTAACV